MKIDFNENKIMIYLYQYSLDYNDVKKLNTQIKNIFIKLIKKYNINFFGLSKVDVFENNKYGCILEIEKIYNNDFFNNEIIDLKIIVHKNISFYLEMDDYLLEEKINYETLNNKIYINLKDINNVINYVEFGKIVYRL